MKKDRDSNIELLRIISMLMIIVLHYLNPNIGGAFKLIAGNSTNYFLSHFVESFCIISVNVFVLITGFYSCNQKNINFRKIFNLLALTVFYEVMFVLLDFLIFNEFSLSQLIKSFCPFIFGKRWFVQTYIVLLVLIPFINILFEKLNRKNFQIFLVVQLLMFSFWPFFLPSAPVVDGGYGIINFVTMYSIGYYLKKYRLNIKMQRLVKYLLLSVILTTLLSLDYSLIFDDIAFNNLLLSVINRFNAVAWFYNSPINIIAATLMFLVFYSLKLPFNKYINFFSKHSFAVFLLHASTVSSNINMLIFGIFLHISDFVNTALFIPHLILSVILLYLLASLIDFMREKIYLIFIKKYVDKIPLINKNIEIE